MSDELKVMLSILVIGIITALGLKYYNKSREEKYLIIERDCAPLSSEKYVMIRKDDREGVKYSYVCPDGSIQWVYR